MSDQERAAGFRVVPQEAGHPVTDVVVTDEDGTWIGTETRSPVVHLSALRINWLSLVLAQGARPVLLSDENCMLTNACAAVWQRAGGAWVVRQFAGGLRDGFSGRHLSRVPEAWQLGRPQSVADYSIQHLAAAPPRGRHVDVFVSLRHPARAGTVLGEALEVLCQAVDGAPPQVWGPHEPAPFRWNRAELTRLLRSQMPDEHTVFAAGPRMRARISAQRTRHGVEEIVDVTFAVGDPSLGQLELLRSRVDEALADLAARAMPLVATVLTRPGRQDLLIPPYLPALPVPLTLLLGAPAVRSFGVDPAAVTQRFAARAVGRPRIPAVLFGLGPYGLPAWQKLEQVLAGLDPAQLAAALGVAASDVQAMRDRARAAEPTSEPAEDGPDTTGGARAEP